MDKKVLSDDKMENCANVSDEESPISTPQEEEEVGAMSLVKLKDELTKMENCAGVSDEQSPISTSQEEEEEVGAMSLEEPKDELTVANAKLIAELGQALERLIKRMEDDKNDWSWIGAFLADEIEPLLFKVEGAEIDMPGSTGSDRDEGKHNFVISEKKSSGKEASGPLSETSGNITVENDKEIGTGSEELGMLLGRPENDAVETAKDDKENIEPAAGAGNPSRGSPKKAAKAKTMGKDGAVSTDENEALGFPVEKEEVVVASPIDWKVDEIEISVTEAREIDASEIQMPKTSTTPGSGIQTHAECDRDERDSFLDWLFSWEKPNAEEGLYDRHENLGEEVAREEAARNEAARNEVARDEVARAEVAEDVAAGEENIIEDAANEDVAYGGNRSEDDMDDIDSDAEQMQVNAVGREERNEFLDWLFEMYDYREETTRQP